MINCKVELNFQWTKQCVLAAAAADNVNDNNIIFTIKSTKLYVPVATLSAKLSQLLRKGFEKSVYWNEHESKGDNKNTTYKYMYFLKLCSS